MIISALAIVTFIQNNPAVAAWVIGGLLTILSGLIATYWTTTNNRLSDLEDADKKLSSRVGLIEVSLEGYKTHVGAGDKMLEEVKSGITGLAQQLSDMQKENLEAHSYITERLAKVETRMPNGELKEMLGIVRTLAGMQK